MCNYRLLLNYFALTPLISAEVRTTMAQMAINASVAHYKIVIVALKSRVQQINKVFEADYL